MNPERLKKLEALLDRVQRNASAPRAVTVVMNGSSGVSAAPAIEARETPSVEVKAPESVRVARPEPEEEIADEHLPTETLLKDAASFELEVAEEQPAGSRRVAASMDEALAGAAARLDKPKTIPPESGPAPLSGSDLELTPQLPTPEQLGGTVSLEEGPATHLELDEPLSDPLSEPLPVRAESGPSLEAELPSGAGTYNEDLTPPPDAREELERVRLGEVKAEVVVRPVISTNVVEFVQAHAQHQPETFAALIDGSLSLGRD